MLLLLWRLLRLPFVIQSTASEQRRLRENRAYAMGATVNSADAGLNAPSAKEPIKSAGSRSHNG